MEKLAIDTKYNALPENLKKQTPKFGSCKGMFEMAPDFDEPLDDFKEYMY
jgi:hypothetical protein